MGEGRGAIPVEAVVGKLTVRNFRGGGRDASVGPNGVWLLGGRVLKSLPKGLAPRARPRDRLDWRGQHVVRFLSTRRLCGERRLRIEDFRLKIADMTDLICEICEICGLKFG